MSGWYGPEDGICRGCGGAIASGAERIGFTMAAPGGRLLRRIVHDDYDCLRQAAAAQSGAGEPSGRVCHGCGLAIEPGAAWLVYHNGRREVAAHDDPDCLKEALGVEWEE